MTKKRNQRKRSKDQQTYQPFYFIIGFILLFLVILASFEWGALGVLFINLLRFIIGELYTLGLVCFFFYSIHLMIKGNSEKISTKRLSGVVLITLSLTLYLHLRAFYPLLDESISIFEETFVAFKEDLVTSQTMHHLGGGMLGASLSYIFNYLFGVAGSKLFSFFIFFIGLVFILERSMGDVVSVIHSSIAEMKVLPELFEKTSYHIKEVFDQQPKEAVGEKDKSVTKKQTPIQGLKDKFVTLFDDEEGIETSTSQNSSDGYPFISEEVDQFEDSVEEEIEYSTEQADQQLNIVLDLDHFEENPTNMETTSLEYVEAAESDEEKEVPLPSDEELSEQPTAAYHWQQESGVAHTIEESPTDNVKKDKISTKKVKVKPSENYQLPPKSLLTKIPPVDQSQEYERINQNIEKLELTFKSFGVDAKVVKANLGPSVTKYEIEPAIGVKVSRIVSLADDIALSLAARDIRIEAPIPGKSLIGIEVPNNQVSPVSFWEIIDPALKSSHLLEVPMGRDISGKVQLADLSKMPHLLIAGATGSGKSVGMNVIITSLLMKTTPEQVKFLMIDPKKVEFAMYDGIPHLLSPVVTNPRKAAQALNKVVLEMERRYEMFAAMSVRNIDGYNDQVEDYNKENDTDYERMPRIIVFVDELADLMLVASNEVEHAIIRLAQMARAAGIHMILATQRPSVDVITGIIKANIPSRLAFAVSSGTDSRTIIDSNGAEKLLGRGDMLFQPMGMNKPIRIQGAYISDEEVERITDFIKEQRREEYDESMIVTQESMEQAEQSDDEYFEDVVELIKHQDTISISQLQRQFRIGYNRAARLVDDLEALGMIGPPEGSKPRQVLISFDSTDSSESIE